MNVPDERTLLHTMRLLGHAPLERIAARLGLPGSTVREALERAGRSGWVESRSGSFAGWSLTEEGRRRGRELLVAELHATGARPLLEQRYRAFLDINGEFLRICTDWQLRPGPDGTAVLNDHTDPDWDRAVLERLRRAHDAVIAVVRPLADVLERFSHYEPRLRAALERIEDGDHDWFVRPVIDSYHTVWFELHEDLLGTLGRQRSEER